MYSLNVHVVCKYSFALLLLWNIIILAFWFPFLMCNVIEIVSTCPRMELIWSRYYLVPNIVQV